MKTYIPTQLNEAQVMLLNTFATPMTAKDINDLKQLLLSFHSKRLIMEADRIWEEQNITPEKAIQMSKEHNRRKNNYDSCNRYKCNGNDTFYTISLSMAAQVMITKYLFFFLIASFYSLFYLAQVVIKIFFYIKTHDIGCDFYPFNCFNLFY